MEIIGRKIGGKFAIEAFIGGGAMGAVYRAKQIELGKDVAIKVLHDKHAQEASFVGRFKREAKAASQIDHPNSMRVLDFGQEPDGLLYIAMELLEGPSLHHIIQTEGPLETARIVGLARQMLAALAVAHDAQILHRDLKPENIIIVTKTDDEGQGNEIVKVCDFGIAKMGSSADSSIQNAKLTNAGSIVGTPDYMSPEQARGQATVDARSDLYSVGVMLYEMMTGRVPFVANSPLGVVLAHLNDAPRPPSEINPDVDPRLEALCMRALSKQPDDRFASAREMRAALAEGGLHVLLGMDAPPASISSSRIAANAPIRSKRPALMLTPEPSIATSDTMIANAPQMESDRPRQRPPMTSAMAALMEEPLEPPKSGPSPLAVVVVLLLLVGGGAVYWLKFRSSVSATDDPSSVTSATPVARPSPSVSGGTPVDVPIAMPSTAVPHGSGSSSGVPAPSGHPSASASAVVNPPHTVDSSVAPLPSASASVAAPPASALPPMKSHIVVGPISADHVPSSEILNALPIGRFEQCYRDATAGQPKPPTGEAKLHLALTATSTEASFAGPPELANGIGNCITRAAGGVNVNLPNGPASADIELTFKE